ncbi:hypothetical protein [Streptomyces sp. NPDC093269]|uniref:hypothetical protein n=1 Tax=Streptomyces sp. NPDC093269 TaxID=3366038 RepID=UPI00380D19FC
MAEFSAPFDGSPIATEATWSRMARQWGIDGVIALDQNWLTLKVTGSNTTTVAVTSGNALINGFYYELSGGKNLAVPANSGGAARVDLVVLRADQPNNKVSAEYKTGGATAPPLTQVDDGVWEIPLAQCTVAAGSSVVTASNVVDLRYFGGRGVVPAIPGVRRASVKNQLLLEDTNLYVGDGAGWRWLASPGVKDSTYTPVWTSGTSTTVNWGSSGAVNIGRYQSSGGRVELSIHLEPSANPANSSQPLMVSLPPNLPAASNMRHLFKWAYTSADSQGSGLGIGFIDPATSTAKITALRYALPNGSASSSTFTITTGSPWDIGPGSILTIDGSYWLA